MRAPTPQTRASHARTAHPAAVRPPPGAPAIADRRRAARKRIAARASTRSAKPDCARSVPHRLAGAVADLLFPRVLDDRDDGVGQRNIVEFLGELLPVPERPVEE